MQPTPFLPAPFDRSFGIAAAFAAVAAIAAPSAHASKLTTLYNFQGGATDGELPDSLILQGGELYGTTQIGGSPACYVNQYEEGCGTVFKVDLATGQETLLTAFGPAGYNPQTVAFAKSRLLVPTFGGSNIYSIAAKKGGAGKVLHSFGGGSDGSGPSGPIVVTGGTIYGATGFGGGTDCGGNAGCGVIYSLNEKTRAEQVLYQFGTPANGQNPQGVVLLNNELWGVTAFGGKTTCSSYPGCGLVFKVDPATGAETAVYKFTGKADGGYPVTLITANNMLYGSNFLAPNGLGTLFQIDPATGAETVLYTFKGQADGAAPNVITYADGALYGTGVNSTNGTLIKFDLTSGKLSVLYTFSGEADGSRPSALIYSGGLLYGTTYQGGTYNAGTVFSFKP